MNINMTGSISQLSGHRNVPLIKLCAVLVAVQKNVHINGAGAANGPVFTQPIMQGVATHGDSEVRGV